MRMHFSVFGLHKGCIRGKDMRSINYKALPADYMHMSALNGLEVYDIKPVHNDFG